MKEAGSLNKWDANLYDDKINFVSQFGQGVVEWLNPKPGEKILDLGCGTGDLTYEISKTGAYPMGIDLALSMIETARDKYPDLQFLVGNGVDFRTSARFDAVFSNAALHWMKEAPKVVETVGLALEKGGRFVAEFGAKGNVETIIHGMATVLADYGISATERNPWYFPSIGEYSTLLENFGFRVTNALHFERPTLLQDGENGLRHWLDMFSDDFFYEISPSTKYDMYKKIMEALRPQLYKDGQWYADYKRIRIMAIKE